MPGSGERAEQFKQAQVEVRRDRIDDSHESLVRRMSCPRCGNTMKEHEPDRNWLRWWECAECDSAWHLMCGTLHAGRLPSPMREEARA
jgi:transposase-like protein